MRVDAPLRSSREIVAVNSVEMAGDLTHPVLLNAKQRDLFALNESQVETRDCCWQLRVHAASVPEPPVAHRLRHPCCFGRFVREHASRDRGPELDPILSPRHAGSPARGDLPPIAPHPLLLRSVCHRSTPPPKCRDERLDQVWLPRLLWTTQPAT